MSELHPDQKDYLQRTKIEKKKIQDLDFLIFLNKKSRLYDIKQQQSYYYKDERLKRIIDDKRWNLEERKNIFLIIECIKREIEIIAKERQKYR